MESKKAKTLEEYVLNELQQAKEDLEKEKSYQKYLGETNKALTECWNNMNDTIRVAFEKSKVNTENDITMVYVNGAYVGCYSKLDVERNRELGLQALAQLIERANNKQVERQGEEE